MSNVINNFVKPIGMSASIRAAVKELDKESIDTLVVVDNNQAVLGVFTMGDFRRAVLTGFDINDPIVTLVSADYIYVKEGYSRRTVINLFNNNPMVLSIPVLDGRNNLKGVIERSQYPEAKDKVLLDSSIDVVIMAGGKGTRLDPFTRILPKPLIPIGKDPIIKVIMDEFSQYGASSFYLSVNEKSKMIKAYLSDQDFSYQIKYIEEDKPLGTAGSLCFFNGSIKNNIIVSNCDVIVKSNYASMVEHHESEGYDLTIVSSIQHYTIPYGVCIINKSGEFDEILEKPENSYLVNTGMYILGPKVFSLIPKNEYFDMTDLIIAAKENGLKVGVYPVSEKSWIDIGQWGVYREALNKMNI
jgi:dTDP-glucose pyrophosphorylase